ncbi:MAG: response regulator transcription factor [Rhodospirillaceae bacterium]|nr:response regulator transcription factor [Rhodospirillaceae bacterium]
MGEVRYLHANRSKVDTASPSSSQAKTRLLLATADERSGAKLLIALEAQGWQVTACAPHGIGDALSATAAEMVVLAVDCAKVAVPMVRDIRRAGFSIPVVALLQDGNADDRASVLQVGADECLSQPLSHVELFARLNAVSRRPRCLVDPMLRAGTLVLDPASGTVRTGDDIVHVTKQQFAILFALARQFDSYIDSDRLVRLSQQESNRQDASKSRVLAVVIYRLRRLLDACDSGLAIESSHGLGYRLTRFAQARQAV